MKTMLLAAGLGTRLKPLTLTIPKPLVPINGLPLILFNLALLKKYGLTDVVINLHHLGDQIEKFLGDGKKIGFQISYSNEKEILGTGGGIKSAQHLIGNDSFLVINGDIIVDMDLQSLLNAHFQKNPLATLALKEKTPEDNFGTLHVQKQNQQIVSILGNPPLKLPSTQVIETFFIGLHVLSPEVFSLFKPEHKACIVRDGYIPQLIQGQPLQGFLTQGYWNDLGTPERLKQSAQEIKSGRLSFSFQDELNELAAQTLKFIPPNGE